MLQADRSEKRELLLDLLGKQHGVRTIIFVNSRAEADNLDDFLFNVGLPVTSIHSDRSQVEREGAMRAFRSSKLPILIATGVTARGIDVQNVMHVINYDLPSMDHGGIEEYTHRIGKSLSILFPRRHGLICLGRTGRIGNRGVATSFFVEERDGPMSSALTRTLLETKQEVPEFLQQYIPVGERLTFEADSDFDEDEAAGQTAGGDAEAEGAAWGGSGETPGPAFGEVSEETTGWGSSNVAETQQSWESTNVAVPMASWQ